MCIACCRCASLSHAVEIEPCPWPSSPQFPLGLRDQLVDNQKIVDRLNAELARKTDEVRIIQQISSEISSTLDLDRILAISLDAMETVLDSGTA